MNQIELVTSRPHAFQHAPHIGVSVLFLEEHVATLHLALLHIPEHPHRGGRGVRDDEGLQVNVGIAEALLDFLDGLVELDLGVRRPEVSDARHEEAEEHFREAVRLLPEDQGSIYGLATCLEQIGDQRRITEADQLYRQVIDLDPTTGIAEVARSARAAIAEKGFRGSAPGGTRPDAMFYCLAALERFADMDTAQVQAVTFEIALIGRRGLNVNDVAQKYELASLPGNFSGLQLVSMMYVGFKQIAPEMDVGFDLSREYDAARQLFVSSEPNP